MAPTKAYLVLLEPLFQQLILVLHNHRTRQLERLVLVQRTPFEKDTKVLQDRLDRARYLRQTLKHLDCLRCAQDTAGRGSSDFGSLGVLLVLHVHLELVLNDVIGAGETATGSEADGEFGVVESFYPSAFPAPDE